VRKAGDLNLTEKEKTRGNPLRSNSEDKTLALRQEFNGRSPLKKIEETAGAFYTAEEKGDIKLVQGSSSAGPSHDLEE